MDGPDRIEETRHAEAWWGLCSGRGSPCCYHEAPLRTGMCLHLTGWRWPSPFLAWSLNFLLRKMGRRWFLLSSWRLFSHCLQRVWSSWADKGRALTPGSDSHPFGKVKASAANCPHAGQAGGDTFSWDAAWRLRVASPALAVCHCLDLQTGAETLRPLFVVWPYTSAPVMWSDLLRVNGRIQPDPQAMWPQVSALCPTLSCFAKIMGLLLTRLLEVYGNWSWDRLGSGTLSCNARTWMHLSRSNKIQRNCTGLKITASMHRGGQFRIQTIQRDQKLHCHTFSGALSKNRVLGEKTCPLHTHHLLGGQTT